MINMLSRYVVNGSEWLNRRAKVPDIWARGVVLFSGLAIAKIVMLVSFQRHLFETYWREETHPSGLGNQLALLGFAFLVGAVLWGLARRCETAEPRVFRFLNGLVLGLAAIFICLSFHENGKGHLHPLMTGMFNWSDLLPYYSLNFFFRAPFLAAWIAGYGLIYYLLVRACKEYLILRVTAIFGAAYTALCLGDLNQLWEELMIVNALGLTCVLFLWRKQSAISWRWLMAPMGLMALTYLSWCRYSNALFPLRPEAMFLLGVTLVLFVGASLFAWRRGFQSGWMIAMMFFGVSFLLFVTVHYPTAENYRNLMCVALATPRYFLGEFVLTLMLMLVATIYRHWRPQSGLWWLDVCNLGLLLFAMGDLCLAQIMGARLDWNLMSLGLGEGVTMMWRLSQPYIMLVTILILGVGVAYVLSLWSIMRISVRIEKLSNQRWLNLGYAISLFVMLGVAGRMVWGNDKVVGQAVEVFVRSSPLGRVVGNTPWEEGEFREKATLLGMKSLVAETRPHYANSEPRDMNVVFVLLESTFNKHLSLFNGERNTQPLLSAYKHRMEFFPNFFSSFAGSINVRFACYTGLYPVGDHKQFTDQRIPVRSLFEILHEHGWANAIYYSSHYDYTGFRDFLRGRNIDEMYDAETMPGERMTKPVSWGVREEETLTAMQQHIRKCAQNQQRFFLSYIPAAPHYPYDGTPDQFRVFPAKDYHDYTERYLNDLLYMDWIVTTLIDELKANGLLEKTLIVITGDHGELLGEAGGPIGHGWELTPELVNVPLIIMDPTNPGMQINEAIGSHVDLLPTVLDKLGIPAPSGQLYQGESLYSPEAQKERTIHMSSFAQYAVLKGRNLVIGERGHNLGRRAYVVHNNGTKSKFIEIQETAVPWNLSEFDKFQVNFLRNYAYYCQSVGPGNGRVMAQKERDFRVADVKIGGP